jgi:hypothetical protein
MYKTVRLPRPLNHLPTASLSLTTPSRPACRQLGRAACSTLSQALTTPANPKNAAPPLRPRRPASVRPVSALPLSFRLATRALSRPSRSSGRSAVDASAPSLLVPPRIPSRRRPSRNRRRTRSTKGQWQKCRARIVRGGVSARWLRLAQLAQLKRGLARCRSDVENPAEELDSASPIFDVASCPGRFPAKSTTKP